MLEGMHAAGIKPSQALTMTVLPVIPPDLRPMVQLDRWTICNIATLTIFTVVLSTVTTVLKSSLS
jgi:hypothetical protein